MTLSTTQVDMLHRLRHDRVLVKFIEREIDNARWRSTMKKAPIATFKALRRLGLVTVVFTDNQQWAFGLSREGERVVDLI